MSKGRCDRARREQVALREMISRPDCPPDVRAMATAVLATGQTWPLMIALAMVGGEIIAAESGSVPGGGQTAKSSPRVWRD